MGEAKSPEPVALVCGILAFDERWLALGRETLEGALGAIDGASPVWPFDFTRYYAEETGEHILRQFVSFGVLIDPGALAGIKLRTNELERELASRGDAPVPRPVNLDPGYVSESKLVLATTKDYSHRVCLGRGIYAEATLRWHAGGFEPWPWTYADYRSEGYLAFFAEVRARLRERKVGKR
jgi:hypothetical protein